MADVLRADQHTFGASYYKEVGIRHDAVQSVPGVRLNDEQQLSLLRQFGAYQADIPFFRQDEGLRYRPLNDMFNWSDVVTLYCMMRHFRPRTIVEVGSGFSSAVMLDTADRFLDYPVQLTCIEPFEPGRLYSVLRPQDHARTTIVQQRVQDVDLALFASLGENDILFVDSSHVAKFGSDVCHLLFHVLPHLSRGVLIHFHDVLWPFEYLQAWLLRGWAWNEAYFLRSFLQFNDTFSILFFNSYLGNVHTAAVHEYSPLSAVDSGGSLWLRKER